MRHVVLAACASTCLTAFAAPTLHAQTPARNQAVLAVDHYVPVVSTAPAMEGDVGQIYVRERVLAGTALRSASLEGRVILFVHGAGTPAEVAFDPPGASWMAYLAAAGYDAFSVDMTGYGLSTRPPAMNDPCNLPEGQQAEFVPVLIPSTCEPSWGFAATSIESDWNDIDHAVDYIRALRGVDRVHLAGWSLGGPRAGGYAARHPEKVASVTLLSPAYSRNRSSGPPDEFPSPGAAMSKQSRADFDGLWDRQLGCPDQYEPAVRSAVWGAMLASDPVGATWGTGVRRAPRTMTWGWGPDEAAATEIPALLIAPATDGQVPPARVVELYEDLGSENKILIDLACSSHNAMWETNRGLLFDASLQFLRSGEVNGAASGELRLGY